MQLSNTNRYADQKSDVKMARIKKGGPIKYIGLFGVLYYSVKTALELME